MVRKITIVAILALLSSSVWAQPLGGIYTVGGSSPDFVTLQDAAQALKDSGVSGPTFFNIRPGIYTRDNGTSTVMVLEGVIAGTSSANRITFQPDPATGGNVQNVILQGDFSNSSGPANVVVTSADYVSFRNLTFNDADSMDVPVSSLIYFSNSANPTIEGLEVVGCKFYGTPYIRNGLGQAYGTDFGMYSGETLQSAVITGNKFYRLSRALTFHNGVNRGGAYVVTGNEFYEGFARSSGSGNPLGAAIDIACENAVVTQNIVDFANGDGGFVGIGVYFTRTAKIEQNCIKNHVPLGGGHFSDAFKAIDVYMYVYTTDSIRIANNMISGNVSVNRTGIYVDANNTTIVNNTIANGDQPWVSYALIVKGSNCAVMNNIIIDNSSAFRYVFDQGGANSAPGLVSDHNVLYGSHGTDIRSNGVNYTGLGTYASATGLDTNSVSKQVDFLSFDLDVHLSDCQTQDPDLIGEPFAWITEDYDGEMRSSTQPFKGADEPSVRPVPMFGAAFAISVSGTITDVAAGKFDDLLTDGIAVADSSNKRILLYHNNSLSRSFTLSQAISTAYHPAHVKLLDLDRDGHLDLIVAGDTSILSVSWGDGSGGFTLPVSVPVSFENNPHDVVSIDTGRVTGITGSTLLVTSSAGTLPDRNFLGFLKCDSARNVVHETVLRPNTGSLMPDSVAGGLRDIVVGDIDGDGDPEVVALVTAGTLTDVVVFNDTDAVGSGGFLPFGTHYGYNFGSTAYMPTSGILAGNFDSDADLDFISTGSSPGECVYLKNQGNFSFSRESLPVGDARGVVSLDYDNDGDLDFATVNQHLEANGVTVFLNDGAGHFKAQPNCFLPFASGTPRGVVAADFDLDGRTDIAVASTSDAVVILYNYGGGITGVRAQRPRTIPSAFTLEQNYPNPFNPTTEIGYAIPLTGIVTLKVYDGIGREIATLVNEMKAAGNYRVRFDAAYFASGVYFYQLTSGAFTDRKKMILMR